MLLHVVASAHRRFAKSERATFVLRFALLSREHGRPPAQKSCRLDRIRSRTGAPCTPQDQRSVLMQLSWLKTYTACFATRNRRAECRGCSVQCNGRAPLSGANIPHPAGRLFPWHWHERTGEVGSATTFRVGPAREEPMSPESGLRPYFLSWEKCPAAGCRDRRCQVWYGRKRPSSGRVPCG